MTSVQPRKEDNLFRYEGADGYEPAGLIHFRFEGKEMVALIRERALFEEFRRKGSTLAEFANSDVSPQVYGAGVVLEKKIPMRHAFGAMENSDEAIARGERATRVFAKLGHQVVTTGGQFVEIDGESWNVRDVPNKVQRDHPDEWDAAEQEHRRSLGSEE
jgi:hypothetical protein